jgi:CBS domain-containing protein
MTIAAILGRKGAEVSTITADTSVRAAIAILAERRIGAVPVVEGEGEGEGVAGVFSERDVIQGLAGGGELLQRPVSEVMTTPAVTVSPHDSVLGALSLMTQRRIRHLPVVESGRLVGIVSIGDLVKFRIDHIEAEAAAMRDYIQQA